MAVICMMTIIKYFNTLEIYWNQLVFFKKQDEYMSQKKLKNYEK